MKLPKSLFCKCKNGTPCADTMFSLEQWFTKTLETEIAKALEAELRGLVYMYTHQWPGDDKQRVCENCGEVVEKWTVCEASQLKANDLVRDILTALSHKE